MKQFVRAAALVAATALAGCGGGKAPVVEALRLPADSTGKEHADPALAVDQRSGDLLMTWSSGDTSGYAIRFARSADGGTTWSSPVTVSGPSADIHPHSESAPRLVASPTGVLAVVWSNAVNVKGRRWPASNIRVARSTDGGRTWSTALTLNDDSSGTPAGHLFHGAAFEGDSTLLVAWLDERQAAGPVHAMPGMTMDAPMVGHEHSQGDAEPDARVWMARSNNLGATWATTNQPLWSAVCPCCRIGLSRGPDGKVTAAWRKHFPGDVRDVVIGPLDASGAAPEPRRVHADEWVYPGCPHAGPAIAMDSAGVAQVAWYSGKQGAAGVYYARQTAPGASSFTEPVALVQARTLPAAHAALAPRSGGGAWIAWDVNREGRHLASLAILDGSGKLMHEVALDSLEGADHPQIVALKGGGVVVAWARTGQQPSVQLARIRESE